MRVTFVSVMMTIAIVVATICCERADQDDSWRGRDDYGNRRSD